MSEWKPLLLPQFFCIFGRRTSETSDRFYYVWSYFFRNTSRVPATAETSDYQSQNPLKCWERALNRTKPRFCKFALFTCASKCYITVLRSFPIRSQLAFVPTFYSNIGLILLMRSAILAPIFHTFSIRCKKLFTGPIF